MTPIDSNGANSGRRTLIEEGTEFKGSIRSSCPIVVNGRIEGEIETPSLSVSKSGAVYGRAKVGEVRSEGELAGEYDADSVSLSGSVKDSTVIRAKTLEVRLSTDTGKMQVVFGEVELAVGETPSDEVEAGRRRGAAIKPREPRPPTPEGSE